MPQTAERKSIARYIRVDKGATHPALQREELPKHMAIYADYGVTGTDPRQRPELNWLTAVQDVLTALWCSQRHSLPTVQQTC